MLILPGKYGGSSILDFGQLFIDPATKFEISFISCNETRFKDCNWPMYLKNLKLKSKLD